ncbi:6-phosphogluconolactonase, partial [Tropheryma whipplei]
MHFPYILKACSDKDLLGLREIYLVVLHAFVCARPRFGGIMLSTHFQVRAFPNKSLLVEEVANRFLLTLENVLQKKASAHVGLEGGTMSELTLSRIAMYAARAKVIWNRVHFWWSDERYLPDGNSHRNYEQAKRCLFSRVKVPEGNIHQIPFIPGDINLAVRRYSDELERLSQDNGKVPEFDILFLGMGPDGHTASLFPNMSHPNVSVVPVFNAPKPPPERISMTLGAINSANRIWVQLSGLEKAKPLKSALEGADVLE